MFNKLKTSKKHVEQMVSVRNQSQAITKNTSAHVILVHGGLLVVNLEKILVTLETLASLFSKIGSLLSLEFWDSCFSFS